MSVSLTPAERLKFALLADGLDISERAAAYLADRNGGRALTPADYPSTSGVILRLPDDVWVNAPIQAHNPNFVGRSGQVLDVDADRQLFVRYEGDEIPASFWIPPAYHDQSTDTDGWPTTDVAFTHGDRVRLSPISGCSMTCKFCDLPYTSRYRTKSVERIVDGLKVALSDPIQPAHHVLISGGSPRATDVGYVRDVYSAVVDAAGPIPVDIMMVPMADLMDPAWLADIGVREVSVNLEIWDEATAGQLMIKKSMQGRRTYLDYLERATTKLGSGRVRSMLMVGLDSIDDTLAGVDAIARTGAVPVLSPFRPDPDTPLRDRRPPSATDLETVFLRARDLVDHLGVALGPSCIPCSHNTLTFARDARHGSYHAFGEPVMV